MWGRGFNRDEGKSYRLGYPNQRDDPSENDMLRFYKGEISSEPSGDFIDNIHKKWYGNHRLLEAHHGYIQWIFPIREEGVNGYASRLQYHELKQFREDPIIRARVIKSYEMMLDFYGMVLVDRETGEVARNPDTWASRYAHLNSSFHNYLRISRILKALGEFGFERFKHHWIDLFITEIFENQQLSNTLQSLQRFWVATLRNKDERIERKNRIHQYLKEKDTDDEGDDRGDNPDFADLPSPPPLVNDESASESEATNDKMDEIEAGSEDDSESETEKSASDSKDDSSKTESKDSPKDASVEESENEISKSSSVASLESKLTNLQVSVDAASHVALAESEIAGSEAPPEASFTTPTSPTNDTSVLSHISESEATESKVHQPAVHEHTSKMESIAEIVTSEEDKEDAASDKKPEIEKPEAKNGDVESPKDKKKKTKHEDNNSESPSNNQAAKDNSESPSNNQAEKDEKKDDQLAAKHKKPSTEKKEKKPQKEEKEESIPAENGKIAHKTKIHKRKQTKALDDSADSPVHDDQPPESESESSEDSDVEKDKPDPVDTKTSSKKPAKSDTKPAKGKIATPDRSKAKNRRCTIL